MIQFFKLLGRRAEAYYTHLGRARARQILLGLDERLLEDAGFSRRLLEAGTDSWPWRQDVGKAEVTSADDMWAKQPQTHPAKTVSGKLHNSLIKLDATNQAAATAIRKSIAATESQAIKELSTYTDKELMDIGLTRDTIQEAVLFGRPGIDTPDSGDRNAA